MLDEEQLALVKPYVSHTDRQVFALQHLPEAVKGAVFARYSRTHKDVKEMLVTEFLKPQLGLVLPTVDNRTTNSYAQEFFERVLVEYGDDSVAELAGAHIAVENVSSLMGDMLTDARIGISPLEKSGRYLTFEGNDWYHTPVELGLTPTVRAAYEQHMDELMKVYLMALTAARREFTKLNPRDDGTTLRAWRRSIDAQAADACKNILPASRLTNLGLFGNARAFELLDSKLLSSRGAEPQDIGRQMLDALNAVVPEFTRRIGVDAWFDQRNRVIHLMRTPEYRRYDRRPVVLVDPIVVTNELANICRALVYPSWGAHEIWHDCAPSGLDDQARLIGSALTHRESRRDKPPRAFEQATFTFEMYTTYGAYRDLRRHRLLSRGRTALGASEEFAEPHPVWVDAVGDQYRNVMGASVRLYQHIERVAGPDIAEYTMPRASKIRWFMTANLRELYHLMELRSQRQGHPEYRDIAQRIYRELKELHPGLVQRAYVDMESYDLTRLAAEQRREQKLSAMEQQQEQQT